jgi:hypothetical protein
MLWQGSRRAVVQQSLPVLGKLQQRAIKLLWRLRSRKALTAVSVCSNPMAQRAVDIRTSYFKSLVAISALAFLRIGNASLHRPLDAKAIPRSAPLEPPVDGAFEFACPFAATHNKITTRVSVGLWNRSAIGSTGFITFARSISPHLSNRQLRCRIQRQWHSSAVNRRMPELTVAPRSD